MQFKGLQVICIIRNVVVLEISGSRECLVVPAFDIDGFEVNEFIAAQEKLGCRSDQIFVELDNSQHVDFESGYSGKKAYWLVSRYTRLAAKVVKNSKRIGTMDAAGFSQIVTGIIQFAETHPERFSNSILKKLRKAM